MICIVDYGMGNIGSIQNMLNKLGVHSIISSDPEVIEDASQLILPGVGHFQRGMERLVELNLVDLLNKKVLVDRIPSLGICLGMQLMGKLSEEGNSAGLGWFDAEFKKFDLQKTNYPIKVPCIGWNEVTLKKSSKLFEGIDQPRFYFVHSYHAVCNQSSEILAEAEYGYKYTAAYEKENIYGVQFHPEKSHKYGLQLFQNFITFCK